MKESNVIILILGKYEHTMHFISKLNTQEKSMPVYGTNFRSRGNSSPSQVLKLANINREVGID